MCYRSQILKHVTRTTAGAADSANWVACRRKADRPPHSWSRLARSDGKHGRSRCRAPFIMLSRSRESMRAGGSIILTGSTTGSMGTPAFSVYSATKAAIRNFARSWALDLKGTGIRVNVLAPGATTTPGLLNGLAKTGMQEALLAGLASQAPLERVGNPDETAAVALFLASDDSGFMTGSEVFVDGGLAQV